MNKRDKKIDYWLKKIRGERIAQDERWGEQDHHPLLWFSIIGEEYGELCRTFNEYTFDRDIDHLGDLKREAVQIAAVCVAMLEYFDRNEEDGFALDGERNKFSF